ncbi:MAG: hypothetical protein HOE90_00135 [Bacteriovoracaceae bacterium]|nr:hypothetical protein [Bacteriovoracaceae bacterium]
MKRTFIVLLIILVSSSCKFFNDPPPPSNSLGAGMSESDAVVDLSKLRKFLEEDISAELRYVQRKLNFYALVDQRVNPELLDRKELQRFLQKFLGSDRDTIDGVTMLFTVNKHIFGESEGHISVSNLNNLFDFLVDVNQALIPIFQAYKIRSKQDTLKESEFLFYRKKAVEGFKVLSSIINRNIKKHNNTYEELSTQSILKLISMEDNEKLVKDAEKMRSIKVVFLGGNQDLYTYDEIKRLLDILPTLGPTILDLFLIPHIKFNSMDSHMKFLKKALDDFEGLLYYEGEDYPYFTIKEMMSFTESLEMNFFDLSELYDSVKTAKKKFLGTDSDWFSYQDIKKVIFHFREVLNRIQHFHKLYDTNEDYLAGSEEVDPQSLTLADPSKDRLNSIFKRILKTYKYMPIEKGFSAFGYEIERSKRGVIEIGVMEYVIEQFIKVYGTSKGGTSGLTTSGFKKIIDDYQDFVTEMGFWRNPVIRMVNSQSLMADYFRNHSNGNDLLELEEIIGVVLMDMSSVHFSDDIYPRMEKNCKDDEQCSIQRQIILEKCSKFKSCDPNEYPIGIGTKYFFENFYDALLPFQKRFPAFFEAAQRDKWTIKDKARYIRAVSKFSRHCPFDYADENPDMEISIRFKDLTLIGGGFISIEEAFLRFDTNRNGRLDINHNDPFKASLKSNELYRVFKHFKTAIYKILISLDMGMDHIKNPEKREKKLEKLARTVFFYLIIKGELPTKAVVNMKEALETMSETELLALPDPKVKMMPLIPYYLFLKRKIKRKRPRPGRLELAKVLVNLVPASIIPHPDCYIDKVVPR